MKKEKASTKEVQRNFFRLRRNGADGSPDAQWGGRAEETVHTLEDGQDVFLTAYILLRENYLKEN